MAKNQTYKAFVARPSHVLGLDGELLDGALVLAWLASEVRDISAYATYVVRNDKTLGGELARVTASAPSEAGRQAGVTMPNFLATGKSGRSREEKLVQHNVVTAYRSYQERVNAANGDSSKYVSQGWKRTVNAAAPSYGEDSVNLGAVDSAYARIENNPFTDGEIVLKIVIQGQWYRLIFDFDNERFTEGKVTLPVIKADNGQPVFIFTVVTDNPVVQFSGDYTIGVDVGITDYATVVVRNSSTGQIVHTSTLSQRVHFSSSHYLRPPLSRSRTSGAPAPFLANNSHIAQQTRGDARKHRDTSATRSHAPPTRTHNRCNKLRRAQS